MDGLKRVRLTCNTNGDDWAPGCLQLEQSPLYPFYLPNLEVFELAQFEEPLEVLGYAEDEEGYAADFWPMSSRALPIANNLTTLSLLRASASAIAFETLLKQTPNLRAFELEFFQDTEVFPLDLSRLKSALDLVQKTLTHITIRFEVFPGEDEDARDYVTVVYARLGSFREYQALKHMELSLHILFGSEDSMNGVFYPLSAVLPPNLQSLTITDDLLMFADFQQYFEDMEAMAIFRRYLTGEKLLDRWQGNDWRTQDQRFDWVPGAIEGEWRIATPQLKRFVYDLRKRGYLSMDYWNNGKIRNQFRRMCKEQGIEGEVLWEKMKWEI